MIQAKDQLSRKLRKNEVNKTKIAAIKIFANFFIIACYVGIFYVIIRVVNDWSPDILKENNCKNTNFGSIDDIQDFTVLHYFYLMGLSFIFHIHQSIACSGLFKQIRNLFPPGGGFLNKLEICSTPVCP